jgi:flagellin
VVDSSVARDAFVSYDPWGVGTKGLQVVPGTYIIRTAISGNDGKITFVGDDPILRALSLQTIQKATETQFAVDVKEAHSQTVLAKGVNISGNNLIGVVHKDVDVQFSSNSGVKVTWDPTDKKFTLTGGAANEVSTFIHISDNTTVFHIGANQKQDIGVGIGDMSTRALGVNNILVTSNEQANIAIGKLDIAINRVSSERAKLGALQNRLEHTINNLSVTSENLSASESRIRDVDMAKEMMNFTKFNILQQAATAMLAQANQMPQTVLQLLR